MQNVDFISLLLFIIGVFFVGALFQAYIERKRRKENYGIALTLFIIGILIIVISLWVISKQT